MHAPFLTKSNGRNNRFRLKSKLDFHEIVLPKKVFYTSPACLGNFGLFFAAGVQNF